MDMIQLAAGKHILIMDLCIIKQIPALFARTRDWLARLMLNPLVSPAELMIPGT